MQSRQNLADFPVPGRAVSHRLAYPRAPHPACPGRPSPEILRPMSTDLASAAVSTMNLRALKLRPGMSLQIQRPVAGAAKEEMQFLAAIDGKGVMAGAHAGSPPLASLRPGDEYVVSGFTGQYDFNFPSRVLQIFEEPFPYALLAYPPQVEVRMVRRSLRMKTSVPAKVSLPGGSSSIAATMIDVSPAGAMIKAPTSVGAVNDEVNLSFSVDVDGNPMSLVLLASICHTNRGDDGMNIGLLFKNASPNDKLALHYLGQTAGA
ncbi:MAG: PilZ domain-containing protein [Aquabacterium sp.]|nr:MAG: PilZ domain-containing protein [Aquabacterium sp.]